MRLFDILISHISSASGKLIKILVSKMKCYHHAVTCNFSIHISRKFFLFKINTNECHGLSSKTTTELVTYESFTDFLISGPAKHQFLFYFVINQSMKYGAYSYGRITFIFKFFNKLIHHNQFDIKRRKDYVFNILMISL